MEQELKKKKSLLIISIVSLIIVLLGSAYAFFTYFKRIEAFAITSSTIKAEFAAGTNSVVFSNAYPISESFALSNLEKLTYVDFTVSSDIDSETQVIKYEVFLTEEEGNTLDNSFVKVYLTDENNLKITEPVPYSSLENTTYPDSPNGKVIYTDSNLGTFSRDFRLYVWLDSSYEQNEVSQTFSFKVNLYAYNADFVPAYESIQSAIELKKMSDSNCTDITTVEDGVTYLSGSNDCIDFNYVWYSGKLWRIIQINEDGTMKIITEDLMTTINWGSAATVSETDLASAYSTSWIREWLNQEFLPTLYNYENVIVQNAGWYSITDSNEIPVKPSGNYTLTEPVGLLSAYEYYKSYEKLGDYTDGYLNVGYAWHLITPYDYSNVRRVIKDGNLDIINLSSSGYIGVRPVVNLKRTIKLSDGKGTIDEPYIITGNREKVIKNTTLISSRSSGEYVKLEGDTSAQVFRIVGTEKVGEPLTTKLVLNDYLKTTSILTKSFASSSTSLWTNVSATNVSYWRGYLNKTWLAKLNEDMLEKGTYYLGYYDGGSYKMTVCNTVSSETSIKDCIENDNVVSNTSNSDYIGLLRVGEMFASQPKYYTSENAKDQCLISPYATNFYWTYINYNHVLANSKVVRVSCAVRPTINLTDTVVIKSGSGTEKDPFIVGLPS